MKLPNKSTAQEIDIRDFYAVKVGAIWKGLKQEHFSFWALCAYFFFEYVRPQSIYPQIDILPWAQICLLLTIGGAFLDPSVKWVGNAANKFMVAFLFVILASSAFAVLPMESFNNLNLFINWFLIYFLTISILNTEKRFFIFFLAFLLYNFKMSQNGFMSWASRGFSFATWGLKGTPGWFSNSGEFAIEMLIFLPLSAMFILALKSHWGSLKSWFFYLMPFTSAACIMGSSSRGAQVALALVGMWFVLRSKARIKALLAIAVIAWGVYQFMPPEQLERFQGAGEDKTSVQRLIYWEYGVGLMNENPLLGIGYFNWLGYLDIYEHQGLGPLRAKELPHNIFIQVGAELGYSGLLLFIAMIITVLALNAATRKMGTRMDNRFIANTAIGLDVGMVGYLVAGFFVTVFYYPFFWVQLAMTVSLYSIALRQQEQHKAAETLENENQQNQSGASMRGRAYQRGRS